MKIDSPKTISIFELIRWPIDICAFELAFGYGVGRGLGLYFNASVPQIVLVGAFAIVSLVSAYVVCRYLPSEEHLEHLRSSGITTLWIDTSIGLATLVPILGVFYWDGWLFWAITVFVAAAKALHALESSHRKNFELQLYLGAEDKSIIDRVFLKKPGAFALKPLPTAISFSLFSIGVAIIFTGNHAHAQAGAILMTTACVVYMLLSTVSRIRVLFVPNRFNTNAKN